MPEYIVFTTEYPSDAVVVVGAYATLQEATDAADAHVAAGREETAAFVVKMDYAVRQTGGL